jgi:hypothetical protein
MMLQRGGSWDAGFGIFGLQEYLEPKAIIG